MVSNAFGHIGAEEKTFVPESEWPKIVRDASVTLGVYAVVLATSVAARSVLPLLYIGLPSLYGAWLYLYFGLTQHAGLPENVLDYRTNCRTVIMNPVFRFLYWNMNYHIEHHMFPMVPFHALERLTIAQHFGLPDAMRVARGIHDCGTAGALSVSRLAWG